MEHQLQWTRRLGGWEGGLGCDMYYDLRVLHVWQCSAEPTCRFCLGSPRYSRT
jgi:hypothetical protein